MGQNSIFAKKKNIFQHALLSRIRQHVDLVNANWLGEYFSLDIFRASFQRVFEPFLKGFPKCFHILKGFKAFQSSRNWIKYSEKQIGFSHGNLYNLHLLSNSSPRQNVALYTKIKWIFSLFRKFCLEIFFMKLQRCKATVILPFLTIIRKFCIVWYKGKVIAQFFV